MAKSMLRNVCQRLTLTVSLFGTHLLEDPNDLFKKIELKLRGMGLRIPQISQPSPSRLGDKYFDEGELTKSIREFEAAGFRGKNRARKIRRQLEEFSLPITDSIELTTSESPHRVLFYLTNSKPFTQSGYTERSQHLLQALQRHGAKVRGVTRLGYPVVIGSFPVVPYSLVDGIEYRWLLPRVFPTSKRRQVELAVELLVAEAQEFEATVLYTTTDYKNAIVVSMAAKSLGIPWVYETRGELQKTWLSKRAPEIQGDAIYSEYFSAARDKELEAAEKAAVVIQLSEVTKRELVALGIPEGKITILPNAVPQYELNRSFSKSQVREELNLPRTTLIGAVTSIVQYEGLDDLIRAMAFLPQIKCVLIGDGEAKLGLEELAEELGLEDRVLFLGKKPSESIWKWYAALDVFVVPRKNQEVCRTVTPIKTILAQANGIPVVASDLPALREVTGNLASYAQPENPKALADVILSTINRNPSEANGLADEAKNWVKNRTWDTNAARLIKIYEGR
ncbi:MAG: glycosyltransferase family 4 protein [Corynebacterium sp.]